MSMEDGDKTKCWVALGTIVDQQAGGDRNDFGTGYCDAPSTLPALHDR